MEITRPADCMSHLLPIDDISRVGEARRLAHKLGQDAGASEALLGRIGIVVTEATTNLARHAKGGKAILRVSSEGSRAFELICVDSGPGMSDLERCLRDGYSTFGTAGNGFGAIRRLSDKFGVFSLPSVGTVLFARLDFEPSVDSSFSIGAISVAQLGESVCGDGWIALELPDRVRVSVVDGLGHGPAAALAADEALRIVRLNTNLSPAALLEAQHRGLRHTRGAAVMTADIYHADGRIRAAGLGNISGSLVSPTGSRGMLSYPGIVGHEMRTAHEQDYPWPAGGCLVLHSDGLSNRWSLAGYPGLLNQLPALVAATLFRDATRSRDDATIVVVSRRT